MPAKLRFAAITAAATALVNAAPALAQPAGDYEYAAPLPPGAPVFRSEPVIQPLPAPPPPYAQEYYYESDAAPLPPPPFGMPHGEHMRAPAAYPGAPVGYGQPYGYGYPGQPGFDRDRWLANCNERIRGVDRKDRAGVIGGLLGAAVGGVIGNRVWDSKRLAGTLLGAGVGGLAGVAIGSAIGAAGERKREEECAWYLDRHMAAYPGPGHGHGYGPGYGYPAYGYGYGYAYPAYTLVPVMVPVPQRQVVREYVTEEWVNVPVRERTVYRTKVIRQPAPAPDKRIRYIKGK